MSGIVVLPHQFGLKNSQDQIFVPLMIGATRLACPDSTMVFLNPNNFSLEIPGVAEHCVNFESNADIARFRQHYTHLSTNTPAFEKFCIERFFILRDYMIQQRLESCICIESDVLVFKDLSRHIEAIESPAASLLSENKCISTARLTLEFIESFCEGILAFYTSAARVKAMTEWHADYLARGKMGGICDMFFCSAVAEGSHGFKQQSVVDICTPILRDGEWYAVDSFIGRQQLGQFAATFPIEKSLFNSKQVRRVSFDQNGPFAQASDGRIVRMVTLHYQGDGKSLMGLHCARHLSRHAGLKGKSA